MLLLALHHDNKTFFPLEGREVVKGVSEDRENLNNLVILSRNIPRTITMFTSETGRTIASDSTGRAAGVTEATPTPPPSPAGVFDPLSVQERGKMRATPGSQEGFRLSCSRASKTVGDELGVIDLDQRPIDR